MSTWVYRDGQIVPKAPRGNIPEGCFPAPMLSRMEPFASPVTGKTISSWRERDADMRAAGAVDPRELPKRKEAAHGQREQSDTVLWR